MDTIESHNVNESMFTLEEVQLQFQIQSQIVKLLVKNNILYLVLINGLVYRIDLENPEKVDKIQIEYSTQFKIKDAFLDPKGYHLIVQTNNSHYYYLNMKSTNFRQLSKLEGIPVSTIWFIEHLVSLNSTGSILVGTTTGLIYELIVDAKERVLKQAWKARDGITNISGVKLNDEKNGLYQVIIALTNNKLVQFKSILPSSSSSNSSSIFTPSFFKKDPLNLSFNSLVSFNDNLSSFAFADINEDDGIHQILHGNLNFRNKNDLYKISLDSKCSKIIKSMLLTKYHIIILLETNELIIYNQLNGKEVSRQIVPIAEGEKVYLSGDYLSETYWLHSNFGVYEIVINNENSDIWRIMMEKNLFDEALSLLSHPSGSDAIKRDMILVNKGNYMLKIGKHDQGAKILAKTSEPFEKVTLKLIELKSDSSLKAYLITKLNYLPKSFSMQKIMISSWIVELYIEKLNELDDQLIKSKNNPNNNIIENNNKQELSINQSTITKKENLVKELHKFLNEYKSVLDKETIYQILLSHDRKEELLYYSNLINDYAYVLSYYLNLQEWDKALHVLILQQDPTLIYKCSTALLTNYPVKTIDTWIRLADDLDFKKLLPAILTYNKTVCKSRSILPEYHQGLRFLNFLVKEKLVKENIIHNTLLSILITYPNLENENAILKYLENQQKSKSLFGKSKNFEILFDTDFILRLCFKYKKIQSAIYIYSMLEEYYDAINLALDNDLIEVAILVADKPTDPSSLQRKKLWLKISEKLIQKVIMNDKFLEQHQKLLEMNMNDANADENNLNEKKDGNKIKNLLKFLLNKCNLLTMKDLLPLFPDFIVIDNFKEEVVKSLEQLSIEMNKLSNEMTASIKQSEKINSQINNFRNDHFLIIEPKESCLLCNKILIIRKFISFPCLHSFHQDCLVKEVLNSNDYKFKNSIYKLQKKIMLNKTNNEVLDELKTEIDTLLSTKCCLCSDIKINSIEEPLIKGDDKEQKEWDL